MKVATSSKVRLMGAVLLILAAAVLPANADEAADAARAAAQANNPLANMVAFNV